MDKRCYTINTERLERNMKYTVITKTGKIQQFYVESVAQMYRDLNGGVVFTQQILVDNPVQTVV